MGSNHPPTIVWPFHAFSTTASLFSNATLWQGRAKGFSCLLRLQKTLDKLVPTRSEGHETSIIPLIHRALGLSRAAFSAVGGFKLK